MTEYLLRIVVNEQQQDEKEQTCNAVLSYLWAQGMPGATMRRGDAGIDELGVIWYDILEDSYYNNLPVIIESVSNKSLIDKLEGGLREMVKHGQITLVKGLEESEISLHDHFVVKIYTKENKKKIIDKKEHEKILSLLKEKKAIWATVTKGIAGYGKDHVIHNQHLFTLSEHMPLVIECVVEKENLDGLLLEIKEMAIDGIVFVVPVQVIKNN